MRKNERTPGSWTPARSAEDLRNGPIPRAARTPAVRTPEDGPDERMRGRRRHGHGGVMGHGGHLYPASPTLQSLNLETIKTWLTPPADREHPAAPGIAPSLAAPYGTVAVRETVPPAAARELQIDRERLIAERAAAREAEALREAAGTPPAPENDPRWTAMPPCPANLPTSLSSDIQN